MKELESEFVAPLKLGSGESNFNVVPVESIAYPLLVIGNSGGSKLEHFCILPKRKWARYFGDRIEIKE